MATPIQQITYSNTFTQWMVATNSTVTEVNTLAASDYYKNGGTLYLNSSGTGLFVSNNSTFTGNTVITGSASKYFQSDVPVRFTSTLNLTGVLTANLVSFNAISANTISANGNALFGLNAANLAFGTVNTARLGSGTPTSNTYLTGTNTWTIPTSAQIYSDTTSNYNIPLALANTTATGVIYNFNVSSPVTFNPNTGTLSAPNHGGNRANVNIISANTTTSVNVNSTNLVANNITSGAIKMLYSTETKSVMAANTVDLSLGNYFTKNMTAPATLFLTNIPSSGNVASFILELTNGGGNTINWFANTRWASNVAPTLTASGVDILGFYTHDGGLNIRGSLVTKDSR